MKTAHYTFTTWNAGAMAASFDGGAALVRRPARRTAPGTDNVIDLNAWRAANPELAPQEEDSDWARELDGDWEEPELAIPAPRPRKSRRTAVLSELISTAGVAAAALAIILRVVAF